MSDEAMSDEAMNGEDCAPESPANWLDLVVLIGPPGAGKSTVGPALAAELGVPFRDTDDDVEAAAGMSITDIFLEYGEPRFRELEREAVALALAEHEGVLALGGGAILDPETSLRLRPYQVIFLDVGLADASKRVGLAQSRPVLALNPRSELNRLLQERRPFYVDNAKATVDTTGLDVDEVLDEVLDVLIWPGR
ncbi:MAG: shikimate kinase [Frankiales bacterium]|nr:shikimate kinase [Frankiales bacterium]